MNNNKGFSTLEILTLIVISGVVLIGGLLIAFTAKKNGEMKTFQDRSSEILNAAKQAYNDFKREEKNEYIGSINNANGMCITLNGLNKNDFYKKDLKDYDGYVVIEELNGEITYTLWLTNKKFVLDGVELAKIDNAKKDRLIKDYEDQEYASKVKESFKGNNGTYSVACVNEKV